MSQRPKIVVVGAGPVGLLQGLLLAREQRFDVVVVDAGEPPITAPKADLRVYALNRSSERLLRRGDAWARIDCSRIAPYERMVVWEAPQSLGAGLTFDSAELGEPNLGYIVEDQALRSAIFDAAEERANLSFLFGTSVASLDVAPDFVSIELESGETLPAQLVVAADGSHSPIREELALKSTKFSYEQQAVVAHISAERNYEATAWQRFLVDGPVALLPMAQGFAGLVWSMPAEQAKVALAESDEEFVVRLQTAIGDDFGALKLEGPRAAFPLGFVHAHRYASTRVVLVGDAAHTVHPLAGQGLNLGLMDVGVLTEVLSDAVDSGEDPGDFPVLRRYERRRKPENLAMATSLDALHRLFGLPATVAPWRRMGLSIVDKAPLAKRLFMNRALGLRGDLPRSIRSG